MYNLLIMYNIVTHACRQSLMHHDSPVSLECVYF